MNQDMEDILWQKFSRALFGARKTTDEAYFTANVMRKIRLLGSEPEAVLWPRFLRWAVPALGLSMASFVLIWRAPQLSTPSLDAVLTSASTPDEDPLLTSLEVVR